MTKYQHQQYAKDVLANKIVTCKQIKQACKRYLSFFDKYEYREDKVNRVINFIQNLKHCSGKHSRKPFILEPWQIWIISSIFGFYKPNGKRLTNTAFITVSRKQGKSAFCAALSLYMLSADGEDHAEVDYAANNTKQASILHDMACNFASTIDSKGKHFIPYRSMLKFPKTKSFIQVLSSDANGLDGFSPSFAICDEIHAYTDSRLPDVLVSGMGYRDNPLLMLIGSAGFNKFGFMFPYQKMCEEVLAGAKEDDSLFIAIYTLDSTDDWTDESVWQKAAPNLDVTVTKDYLRDQVKKALNQPSLQTSVKTKNFNVFCSSADVWIDNNLLLDATKKFELTDFEFESVCWVGIDLSSVSDLSCVTCLIPYEDKYYFKTWYYLPESCLEGNPNATQYLDWYKQGYLNLTPGNCIDYDYILKDLLKIPDHLLVSKVAYDPYNSTQFVINAQAEGLPMSPYNQSLVNFNKPTKTFEILLKKGSVILDENPITRWCFSNVVLKEDWNANQKPIKGENKYNKIDGVISILESLGSYLEEPQYSNEIITL